MWVLKSHKYYSFLQHCRAGVFFFSVFQEESFSISHLLNTTLFVKNKNCNKVVETSFSSFQIL